MPPRVERKAVVNIKPEELILQCEWRDCNEMFNCMNTFTQHVTMHLMQHLQYTSENGAMLEPEIGTDMHCYWRECNGDVDGETSDYLRHVYFHTFHVKIKCIGALLLERTGRQPCLYDSRNRNLIPDLPECLECGWDQCHVRFENAELFYRHVQSHADGYPDGNAVQGGCKCHWEGCSVVVKSKHKLKDHFKSHTQEKLVGCPTCGALFSCRTKFFDHLSRQQGYSTGKQYQCSHCNSTFGAERLLRDHMRYHVNQYKCPFCEMTSPSPSNMRLHMKYRHSEDKPFKCDNCNYRCKSMADLRKHLETHNNDGPIKCEVPDCQYEAKNYKYLENHFHRMHEKQNASYQCHVCDAAFTRGALLTTHLKTKHKFNWPAGHSRFRYKCHSDGKFRLQTVRYESVELTTQDESNSSHNTSASSSSQQLCDMPNLNEPCSSQSTEGIILVDMGARSDTSCGERCLISVIDAGGEKKAEHISENKHAHKKHGKNLIHEIGHGEVNSENMESNITVFAGIQI
ncbi:histone H4 transcription factor-like [Mercenaria mercenaria]|uniref:histone H4 transcription factor-like n=1 Tax=Mercenaria mercenaria TaxID=6596 RepID=UPI00234EFB2D|nr:histone H4 transcription factor-like [Mercenaria mercenaria]XP_053408502.1 histone H4 transcription factor-like [Mercenaria mercenaria]